MRGRPLLMLLIVALAISPTLSQGLHGIRGNRRAGPGGNGVRKTTRAILWCLEGSFNFFELVRMQALLGPALRSCLAENGVAYGPGSGPPSPQNPTDKVPVTPGTFGELPPSVTEGTVVTNYPGVTPLFAGSPEVPDKTTQDYPVFGTAEGIIPDPYGGRPPTSPDENPTNPEGTEDYPVFGTAEGIIPDPFGGQPPILTDEGSVVSGGDIIFPSSDANEGYVDLTPFLAFPSPGPEERSSSSADGPGLLRTGNIEERMRRRKNVSEKVLSCTVSKLSKDVNTQEKILATLKSCPSEKAKNRLIKILRRVLTDDSDFISSVRKLREASSIATLTCFARADLRMMTFVLPELRSCLEPRSTLSASADTDSTGTVNCLHSVMASGYLFTVGRIPPPVANCGRLRLKRDVDEQ